MTPADPTHSHNPVSADAPTGTFDPALDAGLAAAFGPDPTPGGWSQPPLLRDEPSDNAPLVQPSSPEIPRGADSRYQLLGEIARGGMGVIIKGRDPDLGRDLAFKVLKDELVGKPAAEQRFVEEAQVGGQLQHPGIVPVYDLGRFANGRPYFAMKLVKGRTLAEMLTERTNPAVDRGKFLQIFLQVCQTVAYAHSRGVIHRDLKPANIMVGGFGEVLVMDWGLAKVLPRGGVSDEERATQASQRLPAVPEDPTEIRTTRVGSGSETAAGSVMGTPAFMSPEQAGGEIDKLDERADVFGLGAILCVILTGKPPYLGDTADTIRLMAVRGKLEEAFVRLDACGADAELVILCKRCMAADRHARPRYASEVADGVAAHLAEVGGRAHRAEVERAAAEAEAREQRKRRRVQLGLMGSVTLLVFGGVAFGWYTNWAESRRQVAQVKTEAAEGRARTAVETAITQATDLRARYRYTDARAALDQASGLLPADAPAELRERLTNAQNDLAFVTDLDRARMKAFTWISEGPSRGQPDEAGARAAYQAAFLARELNVINGDPAVVAERVRENRAIRAELVAALDDWAALAEDDGPTRDRVLAVARLADPGDWLDQFRDPTVRADKEKLATLAFKADAAALAPGAVVALSRLMHRHELNPVPILRTAQIAHPTDFPVAFTLGFRMRMKVDGGNDAEKAACFRAALALRPDHTIVLFNIAFVTMGADRKEAIAIQRRTVQLAPADATAHFGLVVLLDIAGDADGALAAAREGVRRCPQDPILWAYLGGLLSNRSDLADAETATREAIRFGPTHPNAHSTLARILDKKGDRVGALAAAREGIRLGPNQPSSHIALGSVLQNQKNLVEAIAAYREAVRLAPKLHQTQDALGRALFEVGDTAGAVAAFRAAIMNNPREAELHYNLGTALLKTPDAAGAVTALREAVRLKPNFAKFHAQLGAAQLATGNLDAAVTSSREAIRLDSNDPITHTNLGVALSKKGDLAGAAVAHREAVKLDPKDAQSHVNLTATLERKGPPDECLAAARAFLNTHPTDTRAHTALGKALALKEDLNGAEVAFREAIKLDPMDVNARVNLGMILRVKRDAAGAIYELRVALRIDPQNAAAYFNMGVALAIKGDNLGAIAVYREAIRLGSKEVDGYTNLGNALYRTNDRRGAVGAYREAIQLDPKDARLYDKLGGVLTELGEFDEAVNVLRVAVKLDPKNANAWLNLGAALGEKGNLVGATEALREAALLVPDDPFVHVNLGHALKLQGRHTQALPYFRKAHELGLKQPRWPYPTAKWLADGERAAAEQEARTAPPPREVKR